uniref:Uncharacterized protein n=1 Tax=Anguilla anguilla TaxID=7936 RepID=A0A0E9R1J9_ANGAN
MQNVLCAARRKYPESLPIFQDVYVRFRLIQKQSTFVKLRYI